MVMVASIFSEFNLPNATTWFYFSLLLAIALFFKFTRLLSVRNWDIVTLFLLVPGLLLLQEANTPSETRGQLTAEMYDPSPSVMQLEAGPALARAAGVGPGRDLSFQTSPTRLLWLGYLWLLCGSAYFLARCLVDLALVRRPALAPNLNRAGLAWLGSALFVCLVTVAIRGPVIKTGPVGRQSAAVTETQRRAEDLVKQEIAGEGLTGSTIAFWVECISAILCHAAIVVGLAVIGWRHFQDTHAGIAAATCYLLLPYTAYHVDQVHHVLPSALLVWAVAAYRRPTLAGVLLGLAAGTGYFPLLLLPLWLSFYWKRGAGRFLGSFGLAISLCLAIIAVALSIDGDLAQRIQSTLSLSEWQPWRAGPVESLGFWTGVHWAYRLPVFIAYLAFVAATLFWPMPKNLAQLIALSAALVLGVQFWFADQGGVYVLWYLPLLLLLVFRPNLADREAVPIHSDTDWLTHLAGRLKHLGARLLRLPEPLARVH
jgi:hypothetical protein